MAFFSPLFFLLIGPASHKKGRKSVKQMKVNSIFKSDGETVRKEEMRRKKRVQDEDEKLNLLGKRVTTKRVKKG